MKLRYNNRTKKPYILIWSKFGMIKPEHTGFNNLDDMLDFACSQGEWIETCEASIKDYIKKTNHRIQGHGGWREFIDLSRD